MTAKPVPEHISDERLAEIIKGCEGVTPGPWQVKPREEWDGGFDFFEGPNGAFCFPVDLEPVDAAHIARLDPQTVLSLLTELQHRREAEAGWVLVPKAALDWLNGEAPDPAGMEFGEFTDDYPKPAGAFWWRKVFRQICEFYAAQRPLAASPSSPAFGVRVKALDDVAAERQRQMDVEGWTPEHDDKHDHGEMAYAAACYALATRLGFASGWLRSIVERLWPWDVSWWKPTTPRRNLVKAGALIVADIERLDRLSALGEHP